MAVPGRDLWEFLPLYVHLSDLGTIDWNSYPWNLPGFGQSWYPSIVNPFPSDASDDDDDEQLLPLHVDA